MSKLAENIVRELLDDDEFVNDCKNELNEIMKDKKFDFGDLPEVMSLVVLVAEKYDTFNVDKNDIIEVFRLLIVELLKRLNIIEESNPEINKMLESCLKLLVLKVKTKSLWQKMCKCCKCCKPKKEKKEIKIQQPEETQQDINDKIVKELQDVGEIKIKVNESEVSDVPELTDESEVNEPEVNEPEVNESEVNEPEVNESEVNEPEVNDLSEDMSELNEESSLIIEESEVNEESILSVKESEVNEESKESEVNKESKESEVNEEKLENQ